VAEIGKGLPARRSGGSDTDEDVEWLSGKIGAIARVST